ncbi:uncharacterized protein SETTUDRAFT_159436 [Exserohilum turcica Et28A]|uniref:Secreted protein n=1 Tax=Exserohilum turcicum (strain 28A) TaxID=671987 RepID=R0IZA4_EXST2|nr:uncharacterized protein SETTUDRAFT_159436 [Exserohilum turcica Et28A]EOA89881.1 hypothetical protein SETTUDRAFT_159436 [Exserohilum turcica Et28A]
MTGTGARPSSRLSLFLMSSLFPLQSACPWQSAMSDCNARFGGVWRLGARCSALFRRVSPAHRDTVPPTPTRLKMQC